MRERTEALFATGDKVVGDPYSAETLGRTLTSFEDEHLDRGEELGTASRILTQEIERPRVGPMRDIVATIQPEQDELVRADLETTICVQGAPGTGNPNPGIMHISASCA